DSRDLELDGAFGLVLHDDGSRSHLVAVGYVADFEGNEIASTQFAVNVEVKQREFTNPPLHLKTYAQCPDVFHLEGSLLSVDFSFVLRLAMCDLAFGFHDDLLSS